MSNPNNAEKVILKLVEEYLSKKTFFSISDIVVFINNRVKSYPFVNKAKIENILKKLTKQREIIPGTKLMKNNIIENPTRKEIFNYIKKNPAININEIMKQLKIGSNQALWHLSALEKFQFIRSKKISNRRIFFKTESNLKLDNIRYYLRLDIVKEIIKFIEKEKNALKITDIADGLKKNHNTIKKYLDILENLKLITIEKEKTRNLYKLNQEMYSKVLKIVKKK